MRKTDENHSLPNLRLNYLHEDTDAGVLSNFVFNDYRPEIFAKLRELREISKEFYLVKTLFFVEFHKIYFVKKSMNPRKFLGKLKDHFSEGKSGSFFAFSPDNNFIIKTTEAEEAQTLLEILPAYYHVRKNQENSKIIFL